MTAVSIIGPGEGELIVNGPSTIRILEDGSSTSHRLGIGEITIPPHTFANVGDDPAVMLNTFTPDLYVQYFRDLKAMVESGRR